MSDDVEVVPLVHVFLHLLRLRQYLQKNRHTESSKRHIRIDRKTRLSDWRLCVLLIHEIVGINCGNGDVNETLGKCRCKSRWCKLNAWLEVLSGLRFAFDSIESLNSCILLTRENGPHSRPVAPRTSAGMSCLAGLLTNTSHAQSPK